MRTLLITIFLFISVQKTLGQDANDRKFEFAKEVFNSRIYQQKDYPKFSKKIEILENGAYKFGNKFLTIELEDKKLEKLFKLGIFNPDVIFGEKTSNKTKAEIELLTQNEKVFYNLTRNDSLSICCFESAVKLNPNPQTKRFKFWVFNIGVANPTEYYIEFYNENATEEMPIEKFIENSKMTFFHKGTLII